MVVWHLLLSGHEFQQIPGDSERQQSLACCSPWGLKRVRHDLETEQQPQSIDVHTIPLTNILYITN